ncbi:glycosyltransferase family 2 protein [Chiua virens]|nr:glycosyltransferase family 2 protein [Chiua virens]
MSYPQQLLLRSPRINCPQPPSTPIQQSYLQQMSPPSMSPSPIGPRAAPPSIVFPDTERGDRQGTLNDLRRQRTNKTHFSPSHPDKETSEFLERVRVSTLRKRRSLVRPDREKIEFGHRQWHYRNHIENADNRRVAVQPSTTGNYPQKLRRGKSSSFARGEDVQGPGLPLSERGATLSCRKRLQRSRKCLDSIGPGPKDCWFIYCYLITCWVPSFFLRLCGMRTPDQQRAWREKMGLLTIILIEMTGVGFITFGFTETICGASPNQFHESQISSSSIVIHGYNYDFSNFKHPAVGEFNGNTNPLIVGGWNLASNDASFLFQNVNENCLGIITLASGSPINVAGDNLDWYFPCNVYNPQSSLVNTTGYGSSTNCHVSSTARQQLATMVPLGQVYYSWDDVSAGNHNLAVFEGNVLDLDLLNWLSTSNVQYPSLFDEMKTASGVYNGKDITAALMRAGDIKLGRCLTDIVTVGFIDTTSIGCIASEVILYLSLIFIVGVVVARFVMAVLFHWFFSWKFGNFPRETYQQRMQRFDDIEAWSNNIYGRAPSQCKPNVLKGGHARPNERSAVPSVSRLTPASVGDSIHGFPARSSSMDMPCSFPLRSVVPQPPPDFEPFGFPLAHTICLVTAYSESIESLRTTLDSLATTDYPNSHKIILVIADGMVKGVGNTLTTPDICLSMMNDFVTQPDKVQAHSYISIADEDRRQNMAKVYAGFYGYDDATVDRSTQQRVPMILVVKVGNPREANEKKPGNRGKRDSQIILMAFLQKVTFAEPMTTFESEFFNAIWRVTGIRPNQYELVLCVDADTKVFPDSLTRLVWCMVMDVEIMGVCGETKIANKTVNFVTMMQVFEYYISHHLIKTFESMFGGVTCLPGCFSMYRIKAPKGGDGYWVPILANPDIVEHYSENVVDTLHKRNLLLLGEDRYLTTLLLKTFPRRKNMFCPQAVCKTVVPDSFRVLLSQRRRWINSTVHNLFELVLVRDLCGTFCFSMQFVVGMELIGTLVLPAAISFTLYLIIVSILPDGPDTLIPLILLSAILGLPGLLIVVTSRKIAYVGWMFIYLVSLPIWNGVLPAYAFWHFDDFSWGQTRQVDKT